ncbi:cytidine deaminase [Spinellus fusiger]|nr:cytidine deaminase [Spinellus fusiger]
MSPRSLTQQEKNNIISLALEAKTMAYCPYSKFRVGAALLAEDGTIFQGGNIENASYGATICAERTAYAKAISGGYTKFAALAVATDLEEAASPCGICRQFISEFGPDDLPVYLVNTNGEHKITSLQELLPFMFRLEH